MNIFSVICADLFSRQILNYTRNGNKNRVCKKIFDGQFFFMLNFN